MTDVALALVGVLAGRGETIAVCESVTGGLLGAALTRLPGSSAVFRGGLITYASDLKTTLAGVEDAVIARHGVVSAPVAEAMAIGARLRCGADWGVATTGVAGPAEVDGHASGEVWVGVASEDSSIARQLRLTGDRSAVREQAVQAALALLAERCGITRGVSSLKPL